MGQPRILEGWEVRRIEWLANTACDVYGVPPLSLHKMPDDIRTNCNRHPACTAARRAFSLVADELNPRIGPRDASRVLYDDQGLSAATFRDARDKGRALLETDRTFRVKVRELRTRAERVSPATFLKKPRGEHIVDYTSSEKEKYDTHYRNTPEYGTGFHGRGALPLVLSWKPKRLIDLGCGQNSFNRALLLQLPDLEATGVDISCRYADVLAPIWEVPLPSASFDTVCSFDALEHLPEPMVPEAFGEISRLGKPGARFIFSIAYTPALSKSNGDVLHMTVKPRTWWNRMINTVGAIEGQNRKYTWGTLS